MKTKVFSVEDSSIQIRDNILYLLDSEYTDIACTSAKEVETWGNMSLLPQSLIRTPKSDEELAEEYANGKSSSGVFRESHKQNFLAGRKSFGDKKLHLTKDELAECCIRYSDGELFTDIIASLTPPIYPHTITVDFDGENYIWETLKAEYE